MPRLERRPIRRPIRRSPRRVAVLAGLAIGLVAVATSACGGGGDAPADLTFAEWQARADAVCVAAREEAAADQPVTGAGNPAVPVRARAVAVDNEADRLADLGRPDANAETVQDLLDALTRQADALNALADALLEDPNASQGSAGAALAVETDKVDTTAGELGVVACSTQASAGTPSAVDPSGGGGFGDQGQTQEG